MKISWGRRMGFAWGLSAGMCAGFGTAHGTWWWFLLALIPLAGAILCSSNDVASDGKSVAYGIKD